MTRWNLRSGISAKQHADFLDRRFDMLVMGSNMLEKEVGYLARGLAARWPHRRDADRAGVLLSPLCAGERRFPPALAADHAAVDDTRYTLAAGWWPWAAPAAWVAVAATHAIARLPG